MSDDRAGDLDAAMPLYAALLGRTVTLPEGRAATVINVWPPAGGAATWGREPYCTLAYDGGGGTWRTVAEVCRLLGEGASDGR